jgi:hypothetical protein
MAELIYGLCGVTGLTCAGLLLRSYRQNRLPMLFWTAVFFIAIAVSNVLLYVDVVVFPTVDMAVLRNGTSLIGAIALLYGLITESI